MNASEWWLNLKIWGLKAKTQIRTLVRVVAVAAVIVGAYHSLFQQAINLDLLVTVPTLLPGQSISPSAYFALMVGGAIVAWFF